MYVTNETMIFNDRIDAGQQLADRLMGYRNMNPIVLGVPRGGVPVAYEVAKALGAPLDVVVARKVGAPFQPEFGIGAIAPGGVRILDDYAVRVLGIADEELESLIARETVEMERRLARFRSGLPPLELKDRVVIVVDNGIATGVTTRAAVRSVRLQKPERIVLGVPVCAAETADILRSEVDDFVCLQTPVDFRAVGFWYRDFTQVQDEEVIELLERARAERERESALAAAQIS